MRVVKLHDNSYVSLNTLNHNKLDFDNKTKAYVTICDVLYPSLATDLHPRGTIGVNTFVRTHLKLGLNEIVQAKQVSKGQYYNINECCKNLEQLDIKIVPHVPANASQNFRMINLHEDLIKDKFFTYFKDFVFCNNQCLYFDMESVKLLVYITNTYKGIGCCGKNTKLNITTDDISLNIVGSKLMKRDLFRDDYDFEQLGIGGLDKQLVSVLRRCLSTRAYKQSVIEKLGSKHVKGMLLYGPPGCGKTLIARKLGSLISNKQPKIVNGPEIMNKYVGESEKNIRELFSEAINSKDDELHIIIFDEIDAICKRRQNAGSMSNANDSVVNQLLTMIDGYTSLNNIFIIGMTNRKDLLDEALLRAGRLEVHIEIGLPDFMGREQIFRIHTKRMVENGLAKELNIQLFSSLTENYSGAEIEAVVRNAVSRALHEELTLRKRGENEENDGETVNITKNHFLEAINEVEPMFGKISKDVSSLVPENYTFLSAQHKLLYEDMYNLIKTSTKRINTFLISGESKSGKTVLALKTAMDSGIKNIKVIRAIDIVSFDEVGKANYITDIIKNAYTAKKSLIIIDDLEIVINYANLGNNTFFSNRLYQVMSTILKTEPIQPEHEIYIVCTCINNVFNFVFDWTGTI